ncbi:elongator complex protein 6 [Aphomia sociella]
MSSDIIATLQLEKQSLGRVIVVKEINNCDSSFITSCVLGHCIKNRNAVFIISTHNSLSHYQNVGVKMNYNLQKHIESGLITFYDIGNEYVSNLLENEDNPVQSMIVKLKEILCAINEKYDQVYVICDGISHLFDMELNLRNINQFCNELLMVARMNNSFILFHCNIASDDDVTNIMSNLLSHKAHTLLEIESLSSGWSADVTGHLTIKNIGRKFEDEHVYAMDLKPSHYLFKLFDRGVKLFAPGTV